MERALDTERELLETCPGDSACLACRIFRRLTTPAGSLSPELTGLISTRY